MNDDGRVAWGQLSPMEKAARTTQQSFNLGLIVVGAVMTVRLRGSWREMLCERGGTG